MPSLTQLCHLRDILTERTTQLHQKVCSRICQVGWLHNYKQSPREAEAGGLPQIQGHSELRRKSYLERKRGRGERKKNGDGMVVHSCNASTWKVRPGRSRSSLAPQQVQGQPRLGESLLTKQNKKTQNKTGKTI